MQKLVSELFTSQVLSRKTRRGIFYYLKCRSEKVLKVVRGGGGGGGGGGIGANDKRDIKLLQRRA